MAENNDVPKQEQPIGPPLSETPRFVALEAASLVTSKAIEFGHLPHSGVKEFMGDILTVAHEFLAAEESPVATATAAPAKLTAKQIRETVTDDQVTCLECGHKGVMLKTHLRSKHGLTPAEYREKWGLPKDHPIIAPKYSAARRDMSLSLGLGRKGYSARVAKKGGRPLKAVASSKGSGKTRTALVG